MKKLLVGWFFSLLASNCVAYFEDFKNVVRLTKVEIDGDGYGVFKSYTYEKPLDVNYSYSENNTDGEWRYKLFLEVIDNHSESSLIPVDVVKVGFSVGGDNDETTKSFKIPDVTIPENCSFVGKATVMLKDMEIWVPEYPAGYISTATVVKVLSSTKPKLDCSAEIPDNGF